MVMMISCKTLESQFIRMEILVNLDSWTTKIIAHNRVTKILLPPPLFETATHPLHKMSVTNTSLDSILYMTRKVIAMGQNHCS